MKPTFLSKVFQAALMCCLAVILSGCDDFLANSDNPTGTILIMNTGDATLKVGEQLDRPAITNSPANVLYSSSDPAVATVGLTGTVTAIAPGTATITAHVQAVGNYAAAKASYKVIVSANTPATISGLLAGKFSVSATKQVQFSQGNLQATYDGTNWTWAFAEHQWDYIGNAEGNTKIKNSAPFVAGYSGSSTTVDLFGWVGASSTWTGAAQYGINSSTATNATDGYGNVVTENLKADWGTTMGTGWRTLTKDEWTYLFSTRTSGGTVFGTASARYAHAEINTDGTPTKGIIMFPDGVDFAASEVTTAGTVNIASSWGTKCTSAQWTALADKGCVFLPAAGYRSGTSMNGIGTMGLYWSSSPYTSVASAYCVYFYSSHLNPADFFVRSYGFPVRLVRDAE